MLVLTHGLVVSPSRRPSGQQAAPIITDGLEVLVQEVIPATTTAPWSSTNVAALGGVTLTGLLGGPRPLAADGRDGILVGERRARVGGRERLLDGLVELGLGAGWFSST
jgi:hypothetical protein